MTKLQIRKMVIGGYGTNCYIVTGGKEGKALVFDPADRGRQIYDALQAKGLTVEAILLTHAHFDHIWGVEELQDASGAKVYALDSDVKLCENSTMNLSAQSGRPCAFCADVYVKDKEELSFAGMECRVIATPGHTADSCCYYFEKDGFCISGDTLFEESVGRSDFPTGDGSLLVRSIREKLFVLPEETDIYPGHGNSTTIAHEKKYNPFL